MTNLSREHTFKKQAAELKGPLLDLVHRVSPGVMPILSFAALLMLSTSAFSQAVVPDLGEAFDYALLGTNDIPTTGTVTCTTSTIDGDVGSTGSAITNTGPCTITGTVDTPVPAQVVNDFDNAYIELDSMNPLCDGNIPITSTTLPAGVYCSAAGTTIGAGVTITLDGDASDVWVFKVGTGGLGALIGTGPNFEVTMGGTADPCNVYWWTAEEATLTDAAFVGTILSGAAVTMTDTAFDGRAMATTDAAVTDSFLTFAGCAAPATITVEKNFSDGNADPVSVSLNCTSGVVEQSPLDASEAQSAIFTVTGAAPGATCTAIEEIPAGYSANQTDCVDVEMNGECTIVNTLIQAESITVNKDFSDNNSDPVLVELTCTSGTIETTPLTAAEGSPAIFLVTGADPGASCMATEEVPVGYTEDQSDCVAVPMGGECTIVNTRIPEQITVNKDFSDGNPDPVSVSLNCTSGVVEQSPLDASEAQSAIFTVTGAAPGATCTAIEEIPAGYSANQTDCVDVEMNGECTIVNTLIQAESITVNKDFSDNNPDPVLVELTCTSGTIETTPLTAAEGSPAIFLVTGADPGASCMATEEVPVGYTEDQSDCVAVPMGGECTIVNTRIPEQITVNKDFSDNNSDPVLVELTCTSGTIETTPLTAAEGSPAIFLVTGADPGASCMATEEVPVGYTEDQSDCVAVPMGGECTIVNTRIPEQITVNKDFSDNNPDPVLVELTCTSGTIETTPLTAAEGSPAIFLVTGADPGASCMATEEVPVGYTEDQSDCVAVPMGGECTIVNTRIPEQITVNKDFSDNNSDPVLVELTCTSGTIETTPLTAAEGSPAIFLVTGADPGASCMATEEVPVGYTEDQSDCVAVPMGGECTIVNTLIPPLPPAISVPTISGFAMILLAMFLAIFGHVAILRRSA